MSLFGLKKVGKVYHVNFAVRGQRIHRSTRCMDRPTAELVAKKWYDEAVKQSEGMFVDKGHTVEGIWLLWWKGTLQTLSESHRNRVERDWRLHILPALGSRPAKSITLGDAEQLRASYLGSPSLLRPSQKRSISSSNKLMLHLHLVLSWAVENGHLERMGFEAKVLPVQEKPKPTLTKALVPRFLEAVDAIGNPHVQVAVRMMVYWALREKEALAARWEWFGPEMADFQHGARKAKDAPRFPVPEDLMRHLVRLREKARKAEQEAAKKEHRPVREISGLVMPAADGLPHRQQYTRKAIQAAGLQVNLKLGPHSMRHSWATMAARETKNAHLVKDGLGHTTLNMAMKYVKLDTQDLADAQRKMFGDLAKSRSKPKIKSNQNSECDPIVSKSVRKSHKAIN